MTRETKVGLIVGLAFIMVFAVILSHKGTQPRAALSGELGPLVDAGPSLETAPPPSRAPVVQEEEHITKRVNDTARATDAHGNDGPGMMIRAANTSAEESDAVPLPSVPQSVSQTEGSRESALPEFNVWFEKLTSTEKTSDESASVAERHAPMPRGAAESTTATKTDAASETPKEPASKPRQNAAPSTIEIMREYVAQRGDTLTKIAAKMYGEDKQRGIKAIVEANPKTLDDPNKLRAGAKLLIPELPADQFEVATFPPVAKTELRAESSRVEPMKPVVAPAAAPVKESPTYRYYTVKENDTYSKIARSQLGSAQRWKEIHQLNESEIPDPTKLQAGITIKLPANDAAKASHSASDT